MDNAVNTALAAVGAKNTKAVKALLDMTKVKLGEDGELNGLDEQLELVQKTDSYLFGEKQQNKLNIKGFQPGISADVKLGAKIDMSKMTYEELAEYIENNPDAE